MKTSTILTLLLFAFTTKTSFFALANTAVLDSNGDEIQLGVEYYVVSAIWGGGGGGLYLDFDPDQTCPEIVVQHPYDKQYGVPVTFSTMDATDDVVDENANVIVTFIPLTPKICRTSTTWQVVYDESVGKNLVTLGGVEGESASVFTLKKLGGLGYIFNHLGSDIGRYYDNSKGLVRLAVDSEIPWPWMFIKADQSKTTKQVVNV